MSSVTRLKTLFTFVSRAVPSTEEGLFHYLKMRYLNDLSMSEDNYEAHDCISPKAEMLIELKCRTTHFDELLLEADKYHALLIQAKKLGYAPWYVNSTPKGIYAFNLTFVAVTWTTRLLPAATQPNPLQLVSKKVTYLHIKQARKL